MGPAYSNGLDSMGLTGSVILRGEVSANPSGKVTLSSGSGLESEMGAVVRSKVLIGGGIVRARAASWNRRKQW